MTAATTDRATTSRAGSRHYHGLASAVLILAGCLCCLDASGDLVDGADATALQFAGVAESGADATEDDGVNVLVDGEHLFAASGLTAADIGKPVFLVDNQTVGLADDTDYQIRVGTLVGIETSTAVWVRIEPVAKRRVEQFTVEIAGVNAAAFDLAAKAADFGGAGFVIKAVQHIESFVTATGASDDRKIVTTDWTLTAGVLAAVGDETANTWVITFTGHLI